MNVKETLGIGSKALEGRSRTPGVDSGQAKGKKIDSGAQQSGDRVELSGRSREMARAAEVLAKTPDIRAQKVAEIKARVDNNEYKVDADKVAHKMIRDILGEIV